MLNLRYAILSLVTSARDNMLLHATRFGARYLIRAQGLKSDVYIYKQLSVLMGIPIL